jgi:hypothetical protein
VAERFRRSVRAAAGSSLYQLAFIQNCHRWIVAGYQRLDKRSLSAAPEPAITGELVRAMKDARLQRSAPTWMIRMYVADDPPVNAPGRLGKQRRRVDIEFERSERGFTAHFHCEAKRLYRSDSVSEYLGKEGLGMFLTGEYARDENVGGMLGYVQREAAADWMARLKSALTNEQAKYGVTSENALEVAGLLPELPQIHRSEHERLTVGRPIHVFHTLLVFTSSDSI